MFKKIILAGHKLSSKVKGEHLIGFLLVDFLRGEMDYLSIAVRSVVLISGLALILTVLKDVEI